MKTIEEFLAKAYKDAEEYATGVSTQAEDLARDAWEAGYNAALQAMREQEPVAWTWLIPVAGGTWYSEYSGEKPTPIGKKGITPLFAAPVPQRELTDNEVVTLWNAALQAGSNNIERFAKLVRGTK